MAKVNFTDEEILNIRRLWDLGTINVRETANFYDVSPETIRKIGRRDTFRHIGRMLDKSPDHRTSFTPREAVPQSEAEESLKRFLEMHAEPREDEGVEKPFNAFE